MSIKKLDWDSNFFEINIGEITNETSINDAHDYQLLILKQIDKKTIQFNGFDNSFEETKVIFSKKLVTKQVVFSCNILDADFEEIKSRQLYNLAFISGQNSRFKLDPNFTENQFKELYKKWVDNSLKKQFADKIFYVKIDNEIVGFVTLKEQKTHSSIGLIAVSKNHRGKGIGTQLLAASELHCISKNIFEMQIPTQKANIVACHFYEKSGYSITKETIVKHYWKI